MKKVSKKLIIQLMIFISTNNQLSKEIEPELVKMWVLMLDKYPEKLIQAAVYDYLKSDESKYDKGKMPQVGAIIGRIEKIYIGNMADIELLAQKQWELSRDWYDVESYNSYNYQWKDCIKREIPDGLMEMTKAVIESMGGVFKIFKTSTEENLIFWRKDFIAKFLDRYRAEKLAEIESGNFVRLDGIKYVDFVESKGSTSSVGMFGNR